MAAVAAGPDSVQTSSAGSSGHRRREKLRTREIPSRYMSSPSRVSSPSSSSSSSSSYSATSWISRLSSSPVNQNPSSVKTRTHSVDRRRSGVAPGKKEQAKGTGFDGRRRWSGSIDASCFDREIESPLRCMTEGRRRFPLPELLNLKNCRSKAASPPLNYSRGLLKEENKSGGIGRVQLPSQCKRGDGHGHQRVRDDQLLKFLYNQQLQWRFVNARAGVQMDNHRRRVEKDLVGVWMGISQLLVSVTIKRAKMQSWVRNLKLISMLQPQIQCLEELQSLCKDLSSSLLGTIEATEAIILSLPTLGCAKVGVQPLKNAFHSVVAVLSAVASSIPPFLSKMEEMEGLMGWLNDIARKESFLIDHCRRLLSSDSPLQTKMESLTANLLQLKLTM